MAEIETVATTKTPERFYKEVALSKNELFILSRAQQKATDNKKKVIAFARYATVMRSLLSKHGVELPSFQVDTAVDALRMVLILRQAPDAVK